MGRTRRLNAVVGQFSIMKSSVRFLPGSFNFINGVSVVETMLKVGKASANAAPGQLSRVNGRS